MNKRKYVFWQITETITYPENTKFSDGGPESGAVKLGQALAEGYDIIRAIPWSTNTSAGIKYILRKERE
jgi:hypothetical protein